MDIYESYPSRLSIACSELLPRIQNQIYTVDTYFLQLAINRIFNDPQIDLLSVLPQSGISDSGNEYDRVIELVGTNSVLFKARFLPCSSPVPKIECAALTLLLESSTEIFEYFMISFCRHLERSSCTFPPKIVQDSVYMRLLADYICFMMPVNDENSVAAICALSSSHSIRTLRTITQSISPHFLTFICILVRSYCSLSNWPTDYRFIALRFVLKEIHVFALAESENFNFSQSKLQLQWNAPFADELFDFFLSLFSRWPPNPSFTNLFDVWITWIRPWRYCGNDLQRVMPFIRSNCRYYTELSDAFWRRKFSLECTRDIENLASYICILTSPDMLEVYEALEYNLESNVLTLMNFLKNGAENLSLRVLKSEESLQKTSWFQRTFFCLGTNKIMSLSANESLMSAESTSNSHKSSLGSFSPLSQKQIPDYYVDSATKLMYLTPLGRKQVARGTHRFDYSKCWKATPPIISSLRSDEVWWLSRLLYRISRTINRTGFIQHLSQSYKDSTLTGIIARLYLIQNIQISVFPHIRLLKTFLMDEFLDVNSLDSLRARHESDDQWKLRRMFIERHIADYPKIVFSVSPKFSVIWYRWVARKYDPELMRTVREMGAGLCEMVKDRKRIFEQDSTKASVLKKAKLESRSGGISEDSPCALKRKEDREVRAKAGKFELCKNDSSPSDFYMSYLMDHLKLAVKVMPTNGTSFDKLEGGLRTVRMPLRYVAERGTGYDISLYAISSTLASAVLRKGECTKSREKERKEDLATVVIQKLSNSDFELIPNANGYVLR
ncbi:hypothetical protein DINM_006747 [Dirofilaria immitis]|nr:hypothetical protein [Dirofilaria immitis]